MKILTYNIHGWRTTDGRPNLDMLSRVIADTNADIVGLNEVFYPRVVESNQPDGDRPALEVLAQRLGMHFVFGPCLRWPAQDNLPAHAYGNALLSRWPIIASAAHHLTPVEGKEQRGILEGRILLPEELAPTPEARTLTVYVTHIDHTDEEVRLIQLRAARTWTIRDRNRPHIVMGDFNAISPWDFAERQTFFDTLSQHPKGKNMTAGEKGPRVIQQMEKAGYTDTYQLFGKPGQQSFIPAEQPIRIDYIWASKALVPAVRSCQIWQEPEGEEASDHRPVLMEMEWKSNPEKLNTD